MDRNVGSQKIALFCFDYSTGAPKTGDAANLTAYVNKDWGGVTVLGDTSATELSSTNAPGWYSFDLTQGETDAVALNFTGKSSTANVAMVGVLVYTVPANLSLLEITAGGTVGINWGNVENQSTAVILDTTTFGQVTDVIGSVNGDVAGKVLGGGAGTITGIGAWSLGSAGATLSTLTQTQVTGGAYALNSASFAFNAALDFTTTQKSATLARVTLVDQVTLLGTDSITDAAFTADAITEIQTGLATAAGLLTVLASIDTRSSQTSVDNLPAAVWQDTTAGHFTVASSIGKSLYTAGVVPGGSGGLFIAGTNAATSITSALTANITGNLSGSVGSVTGLTTATIATAIAGYNIGNGRTAAYFWQGGMNKVVTTGTTITVYGTNDSTELFTATTTTGAETIASITPT
jgi:hypothetical protein